MLTRIFHTFRGIQGDLSAAFSRCHRLVFFNELLGQHISSVLETVSLEAAQNDLRGKAREKSILRRGSGRARRRRTEPVR